MNLERALVEQNLPKKGFVEDRGRDHVFFHFIHDGQKTHIRTHVSHGSKYRTLGDDLVSKMAKQCKLTSKDFRSLSECTLSHNDYLAILKKSGEI